MDEDAAIRIQIAAALMIFFESLAQADEVSESDPLPADAGARPLTRSTEVLENSARRPISL